MTTANSITVPGAQLHYEVRGSGPVVLIVGSPMGAAPFAPLADALAVDHTVITHDPRGISGSRLDDPDEDTTVEQRADDVAAILDALRFESADVFGSSGGAVTGLALVTRHPGRVRTLVAHEPPVMVLLPDAAEARAEIDDIVATFHREGQAAAFGKFMAHIGMPAEERPPVPPSQALDQATADGARFLSHDITATTRFVPDITTLAASSTRVVVGVGTTSRGQLAHRTGLALAERLGIQAIEFPGGHGGFIQEPREFADMLRTVLAT
jgi:pimeloyl-ACP methyl ester carboxylesterase